MKKLMLIDGNSIVNRAFYGINNLSNSEGIATNGIYGFLNIFFKLLDEEKPNYMGVAFDLNKPTFRHKKFKEYKSGRKPSNLDLVHQIPLLKEILDSMNIKRFELEGFEADDLLGTISKKAEDMDFFCIVVSGDKDLLQVASDKVKVKMPKTIKGKPETEDYFGYDIIEKFGVTPKEYIDVKALMGDSSDNIPGVKGIGQVTAFKIIREFKSIENALENVALIKPKKASENLVKFKDIAFLCRDLCTIDRNVPIDIDLESMKLQNLFTQEAYEIFKKLEFKSFLTRFNFGNVSKIDFEDIQRDYNTINSKEECIDFLNSLKQNDNTAYVIIEENNCIKNISFYGDKIKGTLVKNLDKNTLLCFKDFFESEEYNKISHDTKRDIKVLKKYGINLKNVIFDISIAAYILNSTRSVYSYDYIASEFLKEIYSSSDEVIGKGKSQIFLSDLPEKIELNFCVCQAEIFYRSYPIMLKKIYENGHKELYYNIEFPFMYVLSDIEEYGIKLDKNAIMKYKKDLKQSIDEVSAEIYEIAGEEFNINSPKQMGEILFGKLNLEGGKKTKIGYSTAVDVLEKLSDNIIVKKIMYYRTLAKLKSTYADGLLKVMDTSTQRIYTTFNQTVTATGRISSTEPNLQNIPVRIEVGKKFRKVFIPENDDYIFVDGDYSQIELRVLAHMSEDKILIDAFKNNQDIHRLTASQVFNVPFDEVTKEQRTSAKAVNFGIIYGISAFSLGEDLGITRREAEAYMQNYFSKYPQIKIYMDKTIEEAKNNGYVSTMFSRRRYMPELQASNFKQRMFGERVAMNMPIQGTSADIIKIAMIKVHNIFKEKNLKSRLILQVHDELLVEAYKPEVGQVSEILKYNMENAVQLKVPLRVDIKTGKSWYDAK